jgi:hypothetical protein
MIGLVDQFRWLSQFFEEMGTLNNLDDLQRRDKAGCFIQLFS